MPLFSLYNNSQEGIIALVILIAYPEWINNKRYISYYFMLGKLVTNYTNELTEKVTKKEHKEGYSPNSVGYLIC